jgi:choline dehydrogenase-like flavoprotein
MGIAHRKELAASTRTRVLLHANARRIDLDESGRSVLGIEAQCLAGPRFRVSARQYVLAAGGIENPRLLLASRNVQKHGVGNQNDLVGRFFMEHPHLRSQGMFLAHTLTGLEFYDMRKVDGKLVRGILLPRESWQRRERLLNHTVQLWKESRGIEDEFLQAVSAATAETDAEGAGPGTKFPLAFHCEQAPNPSSRVTLSAEKDPLGIPRVELDWRLQSIDRRSARRAHELVAQALGLTRLGRVRVMFADDSLWPERMGGGNHHMGTTRMHVDPKQGVVDDRSYVHGVANLLVAGSSVFPTGGAANPTLTIVALAFRLADQLRKTPA